MAAFTVTSNNEEFVIALTYTDGRGTFLSFIPERQEIIQVKDGKYDFPTSNGCCSLLWNDAMFIFEVAKHGDGNGGMLVFTVPVTPELKASFEQAVIKWNEAIHVIKARQKLADDSS